MLVLQMSPASSVPVSSRDLLGDRERLRFIGSRILLAADDRELLAVRVVRERLDDVGAGVDELAM